MVMFMKPRDNAAPLPARTDGWTRTVVWASAAIILIFGVFPDAIVSFTRRSAPVVTTDAPVQPGTGAPRTGGRSAQNVVSIRPDLSNSGH
jgi:hypothetical protein